MKNILLLLFAITILFDAYSQGNELQFNRVVNESSTITVSSQFALENAGSIIVPANKVLKITSASIYQSSGNSMSQNRLSLKIGNHVVFIVDGVSAETKQNSFPLWLESGNHSVLVSKGLIGTADLTWSISGVEFNVVQ